MTAPLFSWAVGDAVTWVASITDSKGEKTLIDMYGTVKRVRDDG